MNFLTFPNFDAIFEKVLRSVSLQNKSIILSLTGIF